MTSTLLRAVGGAAEPRSQRGLAAAGLTGILTLVLAVWVMGGQRFGLLLCLAVVAVVAALLGLRDPVLATMYLIGASFLRLAIPDGLFPVDPFLLAFLGVVAAVGVRVARRGDSVTSIGPLEITMGLYILWNALSAVTPHLYAAGFPLQGTEIPVSRFILIGTVVPLAMFLVGRTVFATDKAINRLTWALLACGGYSAFVSIMQFHGPPALVWPRFILDAPSWSGRAVGVFDQPVVNGLVLVLTFSGALLVASRQHEPRARRALAAAIAAASAYAVFLTYTRAVWVVFALVVVAGVMTAKGFRTGFVATTTFLVVAVAVRWGDFTSADRSAGGVGSTNEIDDRLNMIATSLWAMAERPVTGWGIGRFPSVNTYHHQQWSPEVPWERGHGLASHFDVLGVAVELGIVGMLLWVTVLGLIGAQLLAAVRRLRRHGHQDRFALTALWAFGALLITGLTVDLRFFDFANIMVMLMAGAAVGAARNLDSVAPSIVPARR